MLWVHSTQWLKLYTVNRKNGGSTFDIITLENTLDLNNFCISVRRKKHFTHSWKIYPPHLNNVLTLPCENERITVHTHNALLGYKKTWQHICDHNSGKSWWILISFTYLKTGMNALCKHLATCARNQSSWHWWAAAGLLCVWHSLEQSLIDDAVDQWPARLRACVYANGGRFYT